MKNNHLKLLLLCFSVFVFCLSASSQQKTYFTKRISTSPPKVDGHLDDACWFHVEWESNFVQQLPYGGERPTQKTQFKILYDDDNLYVGVRLFDTEAEKIEDRLTKRDQFEGDHLNVVFDSYDDNLTGFVFGVNAAGVQSDQIITNDRGSFDPNWNAVYHVKTFIDDQGWIAEFQIPLSQLRFAKVDEYNWGLQIVRQIFRRQEVSIWQFVSFESSAWVSEFGNLKGIKGIAPRLNAEILPYTVAKIQRLEKEEGNPYATGKNDHLSFGVDGKISVSNDLTMNFTINPDFGQVEADPSEVNLTAFETFFQERRPFFVEGNNIFNFSVNDGDGPVPANLFYSRRIGRSPQRSYDEEEGEFVRNPEFTNILGAVKLSGKTKEGLSIGILETLTSEMSADISLNANERSEIVEPLTNYLVARIQKDYNGGKTILGAMFTSTNRKINKSYLEFLPKNAITGGVDFKHFWKDKTYSISTKIYFSHLRGTPEAITELQEASNRYYQRPDLKHLSVDPTRTSLSGSGGLIHFAKEGNGRFKYGIVFNWKSPGLDLNDVGFVNDVDRLNQTNYILYDVFKPNTFYRSINFMFAEWNLFDFGGTLVDQGIFFRNGMQFLNNWGYAVEGFRQFRSLSRTELRGGPSLLQPNSLGLDFSLNSDQSKKLRFTLAIHRFFGDGNFAYRKRINLGLQYQATNALSFSLEPTYYEGRNEIQYVDNIDVNGDKRYVLGTIYQKQFGAAIRVNMSLSPDFSIQYYGQPFIFASKYIDFKSVTDSKAKVYDNRFHLFEENEISYDAERNYYDIDENGDGNMDYSFENPNYNFFQFISNLVVRWEYSPGSTLYFVWSQGRTDDNTAGEFNFADDMRTLFDIHPENVFLLKFSYRFVL